MMDLSLLFKRVVETLSKEDLDFLLIGGMAVNYYGFTRATGDIDFMLAMNKASPARRALCRAGFANVVEQENVTFFHWPDQTLRVDLLKVDEQTFDRLLQKSVAIEVHSMPLRVPALDDLIAMNFQALHDREPLPPRLGMNEYLPFVQQVLAFANPEQIRRQKAIEERIEQRFYIPEEQRTTDEH
jgi:hypothetical protein